jgi:hypothetical protein
MMRLVFIILLSTVINLSYAYPLDGDKHTGITRLEGYRLAQEGKAHARRLPKGALLKTSQVKLRLLDKRDMTLPEVDAELSDQLKVLLGKDEKRYGVTVLDLSNPNKPVYAEHNAQRHFNPGSVGKLVIATGVFHALAKIYPKDISAREKILKDTVIRADRFIRYDHHVVPFWYPKTRYVLTRKLREGDRANFWTYLDWMMSASSNASASMVLKNAMLLSHFGRKYPVSDEVSDAFFKKTRRSILARLLEKTLSEGLKQSGINVQHLRQGRFFTREANRSVAGQSSTATPRELMRYLLKLEQGKIIDVFSSLEIKRLLYMTQKRIRYASHPALYDAAVFFKSGSLYQCTPEEGFQCGKYRGNRVNVLNSVAIIESPAGDKPRLFYMVVLTSNVLKKNSALEHQTLAMRIHRLLEQRNFGRSVPNH